MNLNDISAFRYLRKNLEAGKRNGLGLAGAELEEFKLVKKKISELGIAFRSCLSEDTSHIWVKEEELAGVPQDLVSTLERSATGDLKVLNSQPWLTKSIPPLPLGDLSVSALPSSDKEVLSPRDQVQD